MSMIKKSKRILARRNDPKYRNRLAREMNLLDQDESARVGGGDQEVNVLKEMNELQDFEGKVAVVEACDVGALGGSGSSFVPLFVAPWHPCLILALSRPILPPYCWFLAPSG
jgi:hypothetical protein